MEETLSNPCAVVIVCSMTCYTPLKANLCDGEITFGGKNQDGSSLFLPCGKCLGCRTDLTKDWAVRCSHEAQMHDYSCVLTLTFNEDNLNANSSLVKKDIQDFIKRLRQFIFRNKNLQQNYPQFAKKKISYLYCGEYGDRLERPHYHLIIFGFDFPDKKFYKNSNSDDELYTSSFLDELWGVGHAVIGTMSMSTAMYCASYITKYVPPAERDELYLNKKTGEMREPEFGHASRKPALGLTWLKKYYSDILANDKVIIAGQSYRIPRYYLKKLEELFPVQYAALKIRRENSIDRSSPDREQLHNKFVIKLDSIKDTETLKSRDNHNKLADLKWWLQKE